MTTAYRPLKLDDRYTVEDGQIYLSGVQALVRLPLDLRRHDRRAGLDTAVFISGYEGSPLAGYDLELGRRRALLDEHDVVFRPGLNEELAANAVSGSQLASVAGGARHQGVIGLWYGKAPGLDRSSDAIRHANLTGASSQGGVLAVVGDDATAKSSTIPSGSEIAMAELGLPVLSPSDSQDVLDLGMHGVAMSRVCGLWTGIKLATNVADGASTAVVSPSRVRPVVPDLRIDGVPYRHEVSAQFLQPKLGQLEHTLLHARPELALRYARVNGLNSITQSTPDDRIGIVAAGVTYLDVRQALQTLGLDGAELARRGVRLLKLGMVSPLEPEIVLEFAQGLREIIVVEEKRAFVETALKDVLYGRPDAPAVWGKRGPDGAVLMRPDGDLTADVIAPVLARRLLAHDEIPSVRAWVDRQAQPVPRQRTSLPLIPRKPFFCSGCPHNRSTEAPDGSLVGAGIGCSGMALLMPAERVGEVIGLTQMGGEGAPWIGMSPFVTAQHMFQNIGDGTFSHSGSLAVRAAVAAGVNITYKLLYNSAVAMTGGQEAVGGMTVPDLTRMLTAEGVSRIVVTTEEPERYRGVRLAPGVEVRHRDRLAETQDELAAVAGVTVLIHDQECATELRRKRKRKLAVEPAQRAFINQRVCEGCGDCGEKSNCLSVQPVDTEFGRKTQIHQPSCNKDFSCLDGDCPSFLTVLPGTGKARRATADDLAAEALPEPELQPGVDADDFSVRITGIGGTGIVTVAQVIATAAVLSDRFVRSLDQLGLAQKGGAVVSDIKVTAQPVEQANKVGAGRCDLYLGCDVLVGATELNLGAASPERTVAVASTAKVPTGSMVVDTSVTFPDVDDVLSRITSVTRTQHYLDAAKLTRDLFGDDQFANMLLVGAGYQSGALPIPAEHLEAAITLNGVAVERNIQAFRRGRQAVADPDGLRREVESLQISPATKAPRAADTDKAAHIAATVGSTAESPLGQIVARRVGELVGYQNERYAKRYAALVERVREREAQVRPGSSAFAEAVAHELFDLMAYKDEYEVARLSIDPQLEAELKAQFGDDVSYSYRLHPPVLRAMGMEKKISLGAWFRPAFSTLYAMRRLRGTALDPFGRAEVRRVERALVQEYVAVIERLLAHLDERDFDTAVEIAALPDMVRGYEHIKLANVERYRARLRELLASWEESDRNAVPA